jgi:hypothetical protein
MQQVEATSLVSVLPEEEEGSDVLPSFALGRSGNNVDFEREVCKDSVLPTREETIQVSVPEYWQVVEKSTTATMHLFLCLFLPKCGVLQKNKPIKWMMLQEKVIQIGALTKTQFNSRVKNQSRKLRSVNVKLAELEPGTPPTDESDQAVIEQSMNE